MLEKIVSRDNLNEAFKRVKANKGRTESTGWDGLLETMETSPNGTYGGVRGRLFN